MTAGLTVQQVLDIHEHLLSLDGGRPGVKDLGSLESALAQPVLEIFGVLRYSNPISQAGAYLYYLARGHAFEDGNKRTATAVMLLWLKLHGHTVVATDGMVEELAVQVVVESDPWPTIDTFMSLFVN